MFMRHVEMFDLCQIFSMNQPIQFTKLNNLITNQSDVSLEPAHWLTDLKFSLFMTQSYCMTWEDLECSAQVAWTSYILGYFIGVLNHFWSLKFWNYMKVNKRWMDFHFWMTFPFKNALISLFLSFFLIISNCAYSWKIKALMSSGHLCFWLMCFHCVSRLMGLQTVLWRTHCFSHGP